MENLGKMGLDKIETKEIDSTTKFRFGDELLNFSILDFWKWNQSDLIENRNRGILAEYIVKIALEINCKSRLEWNSYDLTTEDNIKIEVKSAAYIQAWKQNSFSKIQFDISPTKQLLIDNNYSEEKSRQADIYIFCLLHHKEQETIDPMNLDQWTFYIVAARTLNEKLISQRSISLKGITCIEHEECSFINLKNAFNRILKQASLSRTEC